MPQENKASGNMNVIQTHLYQKYQHPNHITHIQECYFSSPWCAVGLNSRKRCHFGNIFTLFISSSTKMFSKEKTLRFYAVKLIPHYICTIFSKFSPLLVCDDDEKQTYDQGWYRFHGQDWRPPWGFSHDRSLGPKISAKVKQLYLVRSP